MNKKILILMLLSLVTLFCGCKTERKNLKIITPSGTPLVAIASLLSDSNYQFEVVNGADLLTAALVSGEYDIVIAPITAASKLYIAKGIDYQFASIITCGNNYLVSKSKDIDIKSVESKKIMAYGQNNTPDITMKAVLDKNNITANIEYQNSVTDVLPFFINSTSTYDYILTAEPTLTMLKVKYGLDLGIIDLQEELSDEIEILPQAGIFVKKEQGKEKEVKVFLEMVRKNIEFLNEKCDQYFEKVAEGNEYFEKLGEEVLEGSIKMSNIRYYNAKENQKIIEKYFNLLNTYNEKILNGKVPDENFYY